MNFRFLKQAIVTLCIITLSQDAYSMWDPFGNRNYWERFYDDVAQQSPATDSGYPSYLNHPGLAGFDQESNPDHISGNIFRDAWSNVDYNDGFPQIMRNPTGSSGCPSDQVIIATEQERSDYFPEILAGAVSVTGAIGRRETFMLGASVACGVLGVAMLGFNLSTVSAVTLLGVLSKTGYEFFRQARSNHKPLSNHVKSPVLAFSGHFLSNTFFSSISSFPDLGTAGISMQASKSLVSAIFENRAFFWVDTFKNTWGWSDYSAGLLGKSMEATAQIGTATLSTSGLYLVGNHTNPEVFENKTMEREVFGTAMTSTAFYGVKLVAEFFPHAGIRARLRPYTRLLGLVPTITLSLLFKLRLQN